MNLQQINLETYSKIDIETLEKSTLVNCNCIVDGKKTPMREIVNMFLNRLGFPTRNEFIANLSPKLQGKIIHEKDAKGTTWQNNNDFIYFRPLNANVFKDELVFQLKKHKRNFKCIFQPKTHNITYNTGQTSSVNYIFDFNP